MSGADCRPWFVGVWDTVSSVGWIENPLKLPYIADNPSIQIGRHAIAIDERRAFFRSHLWRPSSRADQEHGPKDLKQVWFPGVHCDVGGGYLEAESGLSKVALEWMLDEAQSAGLLVDPARRRQILGQDLWPICRTQPAGRTARVIDRYLAPRRVLAQEAFRLAVAHGKTPYEPASPSHNSNRFARACRRQTARRSLLEGACEGPGLGRQSDAGHSGAGAFA